MKVTPFTIDVPPSAVEDLRARLGRTRLPDAVDDGPWTWGTDPAYLRAALAHWRDGFDWRAQETRLNALPQHRAVVGGRTVHFVHVRGEGEHPVPLLVSHGWPGSFVELLGLVPLLTAPGEASFDLVIPSLPGFGFSERPPVTGTSPAAVADLFGDLMDGLGYERYGVQGGDLGAGISLRLALTRPASVIGAHVNFPSFAYDGPPEDPDAPGPRSDRRRADWLRAEGGYSHLHATRPQTLGVALNDSPAGLASWVLEKFHAWSDRSGSGDALPFDLDELLTNLSVYWFTETITSSMRLYREGAADPLVLSADRRIEVPVGVAEFPFEIPTTQPRERVAAVTDLRRWTTMPAGGHFAALEQPQLLADDVAAFFGDLT